jgi:hypothetical protein
VLKLRKGLTYRVYDGKYLTFAFDPESRGGVFSPEVHIFRLGRNGSPAGFGPKAFPRCFRFIPGVRVNQQYLDIRVPTLNWRTAYRFRRFHLLGVYNAQHRAIHAMFSLRSTTR